MSAAEPQNPQTVFKWQHNLHWLLFSTTVMTKALKSINKLKRHMCNGHKIPPLSVQTETKGLFKQAVIRLTKTRPVFTSDAKIM